MYVCLAVSLSLRMCVCVSERQWASSFSSAMGHILALSLFLLPMCPCLACLARLGLAWLARPLAGCLAAWLPGWFVAWLVACVTVIDWNAHKLKQNGFQAKLCGILLRCVSSFLFLFRFFFICVCVCFVAVFKFPFLCCCSLCWHFLFLFSFLFFSFLFLGFCLSLVHFYFYCSLSLSHLSGVVRGRGL